MKTQPLPAILVPRTPAALLILALLSSGPARAATLTWSGGAAGDWDLSALSWDTGTAAWSQTSATVPTNLADFAAADGTYAVNVGEDLSAQGLRFSNSGYTLSAAAARTITLTNDSENGSTRVILVAANKTATIGTNITLVIAGPQLMTLGAGSTLNLVGGKITSALNSTYMPSGGTLNVGTGGVYEQTVGSFVINGGSTFRVNGGEANFASHLIINSGNSLTNSGTATLVSGSITTPVSTSLGVRFGGTAGSGVFNLDGGTLSTSKIFEQDVAVESTFNFNGGVLKARATNDTNFMTGLDNAVVKAGGAVIDTNGFNITVAQALTHDGTLGATADGGLTKNGNGQLTLNASNSYTGNTTISAGTLAIGASGAIASSSQIIAGANTTLDVSGVAFTLGGSAAQTLSGTGTINGNMTVGSQGTLAIGNSAGTMTFAGNLGLTTGSISNFEINDFTLGNYDLALAATTGTQTVDFDGGTLNLLFQSGFSTAGTVKIFDFDGYGGTGFTTISSTGLAEGYTASFDASNGILTVIPEPHAALLGGLGVLVLLRRRRNV